MFHYCDSLRKVHGHYSANPDSHNRFCEIEVLGREVTDGDKSGSNKIKIVREIFGEELDVLRGLINGNTGVFNSGNFNSGWHNSGSYNSGLFNSCDYSSGIFCTQDPKVKIFDIETDMTMKEIIGTKWYKMLLYYSLKLTEWVKFSNEEKQADEEKN